MSKYSYVSIKYLPSEEENDSTKQMHAGKFLWPNFAHEYPVFARQLSGGKYRYQTGLTVEDAPEDQREEIEQAVKEIEDFYGQKGILDPFNHEFWKDIKLKIEKKNINLDIKNDMNHKLLYYVIKAGGIYEVAPTYEAIMDGPIRKRFYMVEPQHLAEVEAQTDRMLNEALYSLVSLEKEKTFDDMFLVHKNLVQSDRGVTKQTPKATIYKDLSDYIHGRLQRTDKKQTPRKFIEAVELTKKDKKKLYIQAYVKEAIYFNFLFTAEDSQFQNIETKTKYGSTIAKAVSYLSNPANEDELENIKSRVEKKWSE